jgi:integrating conjugative element protein (TIGR03755 family)
MNIEALKSVAGTVLLLAGTVGAILPARAEISLPQVNDSAFGYGKSVDGAVSDKLFYTLGGGSVISQPATRSNMKKLGLDVGWSSDLMCGNFDLKTTIGNQLNGVTDGFKNLMGDVIQGATGAVASLPAMLIQRANPGLYDMLTNGVLQANVSFDKAQLNCQNMAKKMMDYTDSSTWTQQAMLEEYKSIVNSGDGDAVRLDNAGRKVTGNKGKTWIGGQKRGGAGQAAIRPAYDLAAAGFNMMNSLPVTSTTAISVSNCNGGACSKFSNAREAADAVVKVLGDKSMRTCGDASNCTSGDEDDQSGGIAGTGFAPLLEEATKINAEQLVKLVNGTVKPTATELAKLKTGGMPVTANVIRALQRDPDNTALTARLAGELAMSDTVETALLMRRMLVTGMSEPNAAAQPKIVDMVGQRVEALDREIMALKNEMDLKRELARNSVLTIIERDNERVGTNPMIQQTDNADSRFQKLDTPDAE